MDNNFWINYESIHEDLQLSALQFPMWIHDSEVTRELDNIIAAPPMNIANVNCYQDPFQEDLAALFDGSNYGIWDDMLMDAKMLNENEGDTRILTHNILSTEEKSTIGSKRAREERVLTYEEVSQYFYMPIVQAAKELNIGITLLKKKCRELEIPRWPHRKMKSMQTLINTFHELGWKEGCVGGITVKIEDLEKELKLMEVRPSVKMDDNTRKIRQSCFKANYKKRKLIAGTM